QFLGTDSIPNQVVGWEKAEVRKLRMRVRSIHEEPEIQYDQNGQNSEAHRREQARSLSPSPGDDHKKNFIGEYQQHSERGKEMPPHENTLQQLCESARTSNEGESIKQRDCSG